MPTKKKDVTRTTPERLHLADKPLTAIPSVPQLSSYRFTTSKPIGTKQGRLRPRGLWYGFGMAWVEQYRAEMRRWAGSYLYELKVDTRKLLRLSTEADVRAFMRTFEVRQGTGLVTIAWDEVAKQYDGIEIYPYLGDCSKKTWTRWALT